MRFLRLSLLTALLVAVGGLSLFLGSRPNGFMDVVNVLRGAGEPYLTSVVDTRIPRTLMGAIVGAALAVSGTLIQGITRNPLGGPGILGVGMGASGAVVTATALLGALTTNQTMLFAVLGAVIAVVVVLLIGGRSTSASLVPLILAGAVVSAVLMAYINAMVLLRPRVFDSYRYWVVGSLAGVSLDQLSALGLPLLIGFGLALACGRGLNAMALGQETAISLGFNVPRLQLAAVTSAALLAALATAIAGPISFVGLAVPHVMLAVFGQDFRWRIPAATVGGGIALVGSDILARIVLRPQELMVGIVTAFLGAPFLLVAVRRGRVMR